MYKKGPNIFTLFSLLLTAILAIHPARGEDEKPVQVYILSGQSNMVGIGQVDGGESRFGDEFIEAELSVYPGEPDPSVDYDKMKAIKTVDIGGLGGLDGSPYEQASEGTVVVRGKVQMPETGIYGFRPGYGASTENIMVLNGKEVYRKLPGGEVIETPIKLEAGKPVSFKITYLNDQGSRLGWHSRLDVPGTLKSLVKFDDKFQYLVDKNGSFTKRNDAWLRGAYATGWNEWLGAPNKGTIGPEIGFGFKVADFHEAPVLILKSSQGNRSLGWDFLPPGSERFEYTDEEGTTWIYAGYKDKAGQWKKGTPAPETGKWYGGKQYDDCFTPVKEILANFDKEFPHWAGRGYEIAGFVWWQGHKDGGEQGTGKPNPHAQRYELNLTHLINTLRKEFKAPKAPFVVATCGFNGGKNWEPGSSAQTIFNAQMNVSDPEKHPEFAGNVASVDIRSFWRDAEVSPRDQSFHYNGNAETYMLVGEATGEAMVELKK